MKRLPEFVSQLLAVVAGVVLCVMTVAFIMLPISLGTHPGDAVAVAASVSYHPS